MPQNKTIKQYRATLNHNNSHVSITCETMSELKITAERVLGAPAEFREGSDGNLIYLKGDATSPVGWAASFNVPESMSVSHIQKDRQAA